MDPFWNTFEAYVHNYLPDWQYDSSSGEVEAALLRTIAELLSDSASRLQQLPQKYKQEFLLGWEPQPLPRVPMRAYAVLSAPQGIPVPQGKEFYLSGNGTRVWKTIEDTQAESIQPVVQILSSGNRGKIIPLTPPTEEQPTRLFDFHAQGAQTYELRVEHPDAFTAQQGCDVELLLTESSPTLLDYLCNPNEIEWSIIGGAERISVSTPILKGQCLHFVLPPMPMAEALIAHVQAGSVPPSEAAGNLLVQAKRPLTACALILQDDGECQGTSWLPFGLVPEVWRTCYLCCPDVLSLRGAEVTISYALSFQEQVDLLPGMETEPEYKPVMRRLPAPPPAIRNIYADWVVWEYWNGATWRQIPDTLSLCNGFGKQAQSGTRLESTFFWPTDAADCEVQGQTAVWLRWRIQRVDGSGWLPRRCHAPEITDLRFSAILSDSPATVFTRSGLQKEFLPQQNIRLPCFPKMSVPADCWWLCFDRPPGGAQLRLYLELNGGTMESQLNAFEDTAEKGLRPLTLEDGTDGLRHSGVMKLEGIRGGCVTRFGQTGWWLCFQNEDGRLAKSRRFPLLRRILCGAVGIETTSGDVCTSGESLLPLRGGSLVGRSVTESFGGVSVESDEEQLARMQQERHHLGRVVTSLDVQQLICSHMRDVVRTRCVFTERVITVGVLMRDIHHHTAAFVQRKPEIGVLLGQTSAFASLGMQLQVCEPRFYSIGVTVWLHPQSDRSFSATRHELTEALCRFLHPVTGNFNGFGWRLGDLPSEAQLRACLLQATPGIDLTELLLTATTPDGREINRTLVTDPFALPLDGVHTIRSLERRQVG